MTESPHEPSVYVPYHEQPEVAVWVADINLQMFTNISEESARNNAEYQTGHIYFFAELSAGTPEPEEEDVRHEDHYRDAISGRFVTEEAAEAHPDTTVHEEN